MNAARRSLPATVSMLALAAGIVLAAPNATAATDAPAATAATALASSNLYLGDKDAKIDQSVVNGALGSQLKMAVLPAGSGNATTIANDIGNRLDPDGTGHVTVGVVVGNTFSAGSSTYCAGWAPSQAKAAVTDNEVALKSGGSHPDLTALIVDFARKVQAGPIAHTSACGTVSGTTGSPAKASSGGGTSTATVAIVILVVVLLGAGGITALVVRSRRTNRKQLADARTKVLNYYDRLASEVNTIDPKDSAKALQAMGDASERFTAAGSQLATADSVEDYAQARRTSLEGLYAARTARTELGIDPGPELPPVDEPRGEQLTDPRSITVQGQAYQGFPGYTPGAPYFFGGGYGVPGGWYATPFWETLLLGSVLGGGGFGFGGFGGGGYGSGYDSGYNAGYQAGNDGGNNWGGGDFGSGGFGGGDFGGGGGGDFGGGGGGSDGGGSW
jgi:hypothetical protein